ncbi:uncharacterized protein [Rutidosis leptorrhynchoides]|uniref:uncharacterized protein n=1 Tax=Rutidosis leptorrhynchoides TaxID=125765 RepID=UPI003A991413
MSTAIAKVIHEDEDFEFSLPSIHHQHVSSKLIDSHSLTLFPVFNRDRSLNDKSNDYASITTPLQKLFIVEKKEKWESESYSYSSSEADELETEASGTFCVWSPKVSKCKKSNSTGSLSGSKKWWIRYLLRRSNKREQNPVEGVSKVGRRLKVQTPVHELFYVQRRAENEVGKRKSFLPYRRNLLIDRSS